MDNENERLSALEDALHNQRPEASRLQLDKIKLRAIRGAKRGNRMRRSRITVALIVAIMAASTGGAIAVIGGGLTSHGNAAVAQYLPGPQGPAGDNGQNGFNGNNGLNGSNGANGSTTVVTINIAPTAPLPGAAKPTKKHHTKIRVCRRFPHYSAKFKHTFFPKTCWFRFI